MKELVEFIYVYRGCVLMGIVILSFILWLIVRKTRAGKVFRTVTIVSLILFVITIVINIFDPTSYQVKLNDRQINQLKQIFESDSEDFIRFLEANNGTEGMTITIENYPTSSEAKEVFESQFLNQAPCENGKTFATYEDEVLTVSYSPIMYFRTSLLVPVEPGYYYSSAMIVYDKHTIVFDVDYSLLLNHEKINKRIDRLIKAYQSDD